MRKSIYLKVLLLMALAISAACEKEVPTPSPAQEEQTVHYMTTIQTGIDTRATVGDDMKYQFEAGDRVYVESEDGKLYGFLSLSGEGGDGSAVALFEGDLKYVGDTPFERSGNPIVNLTLVSKEDALHKTTDQGKLVPVENGSYSSDEWSPTLGGAVSRLSHFTGSGNFNATRFTLQQQSGFLRCFVRMKKEDAPVDRVFTVTLLNNGQVFREASVKVSEAGSIPFVFAYLGGQVSLENAKLTVAYNDEEQARFEDIANKDLAANKYYSISRSTLSFDGFRIKATKDDTIITFNYTYSDSGIQYSLDEGETWTQYATAFKLMANQVACIKGNRTNYKNEKAGDQWWTPEDKPIFKANKLVYISGNIMSLLSDEENLTESAFQGAFSRGGTAVNYIDIESDIPLILPATELAPRCYMRMFHNCTSLKVAPTFKVEQTAEKCCYNMFRKCTFLTQVGSIELPATTLSVDCYRELFRECTNLKSAPILPAPTLVQECYRQMFSNTKVNTVVCLATDISAQDCLNSWLSYVPSNGTFYTAPGKTTNFFPEGASGIPSGWSVEEYSGD
ncbi:MAG: hypothetical protein IKZ60_01290 [Bacteroidales bacterium]|nr:hypothetical protein [Bacteroidales bacterium]